MSGCPFCDYVTPEPDDGDLAVQGWQEVAHMQTAHPDVIAGRLRASGLVDPMEPGFGAKGQEHPPA